MSEMNYQVFQDAFLNRGRMTARCGFCNTFHFAVDDPSEAWPSLLDVGASVPEIMNTADRDEVDRVIRSFDLQQNNGINACYAPDQLVGMLCAAVNAPVPFPMNNNVKRVAIAFRCTEEQAEQLIDEYRKPIKDWEAKGTRIHITENISCGTVDGVPVVEECCQPRLERYARFIWNDRRKIADFLLRSAVIEMQNAREELELAEQVDKNANEIDE